MFFIRAHNPIAVLIGLLSFFSIGWAEADSILVVQVANYARVPVQILSPALSNAEQIFREAFVETHWTELATQGACPSARLDIRILKGRSMVRDVPDAFGAALLSGGPESSSLADVFYGTITERASSRRETVMLLANVMAHELGHLLLGPQHSASSLMRGEWVRRDLRFSVMLAPLRFNQIEERQLRAAVSTRLKRCAPDE